MSEVPTTTGVDPAGDGDLPLPVVRRAIVATGIGNTFVWFDFTLFGTVSALVFPALYFPALSPVAGLLASFLTFGVGVLARPLGAMLFADLGDRFGRKRMLVATMIMMGVASLGISLLPGYSTIGIAAPILLVALRLVQGITLGGEASAAAVVPLEYAPAGRRGILIAAVGIGSPIGQLLVTAALVVVRSIAGEAVFLSWAWRIPFLIGFGLAIIGFVIRRRVEETPVFRRTLARLGSRPRAPLLTVVRRYPKTICMLVPLAVPTAATFYLCTVFALGYFRNTLHLPTQVGFTVLLATSVVAVFCQLAGGAMSDRYGRKPVMYGGYTLATAGMLLYFPLVNTTVWVLMLLASALTVGATAVAGAARTAFFGEPFPTTVRYSGHATAFTIGNLLGAAPAPFVAATLLHGTGTTWSITLLVVAMYVVSLVLLPFIPETARIDIETPTVPDQQVATYEDRKPPARG